MMFNSPIATTYHPAQAIRGLTESMQEGVQGKFPARLRMGLQVIVPGPSGSLKLLTKPMLLRHLRRFVRRKSATRAWA